MENLLPLLPWIESIRSISAALVKKKLKGVATWCNLWQNRLTFLSSVRISQLVPRLGGCSWHQSNALWTGLQSVTRLCGHSGSGVHLRFPNSVDLQCFKLYMELQKKERKKSTQRDWKVPLPPSCTCRPFQHRSSLRVAFSPGDRCYAALHRHAFTASQIIPDFHSICAASWVAWFVKSLCSSSGTAPEKELLSSHYFKSEKQP